MATEMLGWQLAVYYYVQWQQQQQQ